MSGGGILDDQFFNCVMGDAVNGYAPAQYLVGEPITYTTTGGPGVAPVNASIRATRIPTADVLEADTNEMCKWVVSAGDVTPTENDDLTDDAGQVWNVIRVTPKEGGVYVLTCIHPQEQ